MAGKKKHTDDVGMSKTARASSMKKGGGKAGDFIAAAPEHMNRIIPCGGGEYAYLLDPRNGKTHHARVGSDKWNTLIAELAETNHAVHINAELEKLGWLKELSTEAL